MGGVTKTLKLYIERKMIDLGIYLLGFKNIVPNSRYNFFSTIFLFFLNLQISKKSKNA